jgi:hypothetical protein
VESSLNAAIVALNVSTVVAVIAVDPLNAVVRMAWLIGMRERVIVIVNQWAGWRAGRRLNWGVGLGGGSVRSEIVDDPAGEQ